MQLVENEIVLEVLLNRKKIKWQIKRQHWQRKKRFNRYILKLGTYQCMNMCINLPW